MSLCLLAISALLAACQAKPAQNVRPALFVDYGFGDTLGLGASVPCASTACETGTNWLADVVKMGPDWGYNVTLFDAGYLLIHTDIPVATRAAPTPALHLVLADQIPQSPANATNVAFNVWLDEVKDVQAGLDAATSVGAIKRDYDAAVDAIRKRSPSARIVAVNSPDFARMTFAHQFFNAAQRAELRVIIARVNHEVIGPLGRRCVIVANIHDYPHAYDAVNYSPDGLHPNDDGYRHMACFLGPIIFNVAPTCS